METKNYQSTTILTLNKTFEKMLTTLLLNKLQVLELQPEQHRKRQRELTFYF